MPQRHDFQSKRFGPLASPWLRLQLKRRERRTMNAAAVRYGEGEVRPMSGRNQAGRGASSGITLSEAILRNQLNPRDPVDTPIFIDTDHRSWDSAGQKASTQCSTRACGMDSEKNWSVRLRGSCMKT